MVRANIAIFFGHLYFLFCNLAIHIYWPFFNSIVFFVTDWYNLPLYSPNSLLATYNLPLDFLPCLYLFSNFYMITCVSILLLFLSPEILYIIYWKSSKILKFYFYIQVLNFPTSFFFVKGDKNETLFSIWITNFESTFTDGFQYFLTLQSYRSKNVLSLHPASDLVTSKLYICTTIKLYINDT